MGDARSTIEAREHQHILDCYGIAQHVNLFITSMQYVSQRQAFISASISKERVHDRG
jgi:hypothetical protein